MTDSAAELRTAIQQTLDNQLSSPALLRRFMAYPDWRVPVQRDENGQTRHAYVRDGANKRYQFLFTDEQALQAGRKAVGETLLGDCFATLAGHDLFAAIGDEVDVISINWGSPPELYFRKDQMPGLRRWARVIAVEQTLASPRPDLNLVRRFEFYYIVLQKLEDGYAMMLAPDKRGRKLAAVFTAEDAVEAFINDPGAGEIGFQPVSRVISGEHLFEDLREMPIDGIAFNVNGPPPPRLFIAQFAAAVMATT